MPCVFFNWGRCNKGENCDYAHIVDDKEPKLKCLFFPVGTCSQGENCEYAHVVEVGSGATGGDSDRKKKERDKPDEARWKKPAPKFKQPELVCVFFPQGKCNAGMDCDYAHTGEDGLDVRDPRAKKKDLDNDDSDRKDWGAKKDPWKKDRDTDDSDRHWGSKKKSRRDWDDKDASPARSSKGAVDLSQPSFGGGAFSAFSALLGPAAVSPGSFGSDWRGEEEDASQQDAGWPSPSNGMLDMALKTKQYADQLRYAQINCKAQMGQALTEDEQLFVQEMITAQASGQDREMLRMKEQAEIATQLAAIEETRRQQEQVELAKKVMTEDVPMDSSWGDVIRKARMIEAKLKEEGPPKPRQEPEPAKKAPPPAFRNPYVTKAPGIPMSTPIRNEDLHSGLVVSRGGGKSGEDYDPEESTAASGSPNAPKFPKSGMSSARPSMDHLDRSRTKTPPRHRKPGAGSLRA